MLAADTFVLQNYLAYTQKFGEWDLRSKNSKLYPLTRKKKKKENFIPALNKTIQTALIDFIVNAKIPKQTEQHHPFPNYSTTYMQSIKQKLDIENEAILKAIYSPQSLLSLAASLEHACQVQKLDSQAS
jgi:hypothetical protein